MRSLVYRQPPNAWVFEMRSEEAGFGVLCPWPVVHRQYD